MAVAISAFDVSEYLKDEPAIAAYLSAVLEHGDINLLLSAIGDIAKARGMSKIAHDTGLGRESLYKTLNPDSKPRFETVIKVLGALGLNLAFNVKENIGKRKQRTNRPKRNLVVPRQKSPVLKKQ